MARAPRRRVGHPNIVVRGATTVITRRTTLRKAFLGPWDPTVAAIWLYALADAQRHTGVAVHLSTLVPNHHHTIVTGTEANLPEFTRRLHRDVSCALHVLLAEHRYDAPRELWDSREPHYLRLMDAPAQASHGLYVHLNNVAAGLVERPEHMPGAKLDFGRWKAGLADAPKPSGFFSQDRPSALQLHIAPMPLLYRAFGGDTARLVHHMERLAEDGIRAFRRARRRPVVGAKALRRTHPWSEPRTMRESGGRAVPTFRIGARGILGAKARRWAAVEVRGFRAEHREARLAWRDGDRERRFPYGAYAHRVTHGCPVAEMHAEAFVTRPGPTLDEVKAELAALPRGAVDEELRDASRKLASEVREALTDETEELAEDAALDLVEARRPEPAASAPEPRSGSTPVTKHRFAKGRVRTDARDPVSRVVVLRDWRRGRRSGDPPR
ncbi:MAG: hypothetical protein ACFCGT_23175 [Sandaracinaceae bacterium]